MFAKGQQVEQVLPVPIRGEVAGFAVDQETGAVQVKVTWSDESGDHERFFAESEIKAA